MGAPSPRATGARSPGVVVGQDAEPARRQPAPRLHALGFGLGPARPVLLRSRPRVVALGPPPFARADVAREPAPPQGRADVVVVVAPELRQHPRERRRRALGGITGANSNTG